MRVLIAEDDKTTRIRIKSNLEKIGHGVVAAQDGVEAWELFQDGQFSIVITDWMMPKMNGPDLVRRIRECNNGHYVYVILLTSKSEKEDVVRGMEAGADDFLTKPFDKDELRVRVGAGERIINLEKKLDTRNRELETANDQLNAANRRMTRDLNAAAEVQRAFHEDNR